MPKDPFDALPRPDSKKFRLGLHAHLRTALCALNKFSDSVRAGRYPDWPNKNELALFTRQVEAFRLISNRSASARPIEVIRDMDHRWPKLEIIATLDGVISSLEIYIGRSLLADANIEAMNRRADPTQSEWRRLVLRLRNPTPEELRLMGDFLPSSFQAMISLIGRLEQRTGVPPILVKQLKEALARSSQEYLCTKHQAFVLRVELARDLRRFIHQLKDPDYTKRLHGFGSDHIRDWAKAEHREGARVRKARERAQKSRRFA
jgi:hypothetical protein